MADGTRIITMTDRAPVKIRDEEWPVIASARQDGGDTRTWLIYVRQHQDGRALVYGIHNTGWHDERDRRSGFLLEGIVTEAEIVHAIHMAAGAIGAIGLAAECIGDLPPVEV